jgi:hypothetical protein
MKIKVARKDELPGRSVMYEDFLADLGNKAGLQGILIYERKKGYACCNGRDECRNYVIPGDRHFYSSP